ncbi:MAG: aminotransferase class IV [Flavobacteriales bacterium]
MWFNYNGTFLSSASFDANNRSFKYGDGFFESIRLFNGKAFNKDSHINRLKKSLSILKMTLPISIDELIDLAEKLVEKNGLNKGSVVRISLFREGKGKYTPVSMMANYFLECSSASSQFDLNDEGLSLSIFKDHYKSKDSLSTIKTNSAIIYVLASIAKQQLGYDDLLILNEDQQVLESSNSNLFVVKNNQLISPPLEDGCLDGSMRSLISSHFDLCFQSLTLNDLKNCEEVFLTNCNGIKWVKSIHSNHYSYRLMANEINEFCNQLI